jgi:hypothetical protein
MLLLTGVVAASRDLPALVIATAQLVVPPGRVPRSMGRHELATGGAVSEPASLDLRSVAQGAH